MPNTWIKMRMNKRPPYTADANAPGSDASRAFSTYGRVIKADRAPDEMAGIIKISKYMEASHGGKVPLYKRIMENMIISPEKDTIPATAANR
jgi:hypothetical protein